MARLLMCGFETGDPTLAAEDLNLARNIGSGASLSFDTGTFRSGRGALKCVSAGTGMTFVQYSFTGVLTRTYWERAWIYVSSMAVSAHIGVLDLADSGSLGASAVLVTDAGGNATLNLWNLSGQAQVTAGSAFTLNAWHNVSLQWVPTTGAATVFLDGTAVAAGTVTAATSTTIRCHTGTNNNLASSFASTIYVDDWAVNDDQGASENGMPGTNNQVVLLLPTADSSNTGFLVSHTGDTLWGSTSQIPPKGTALSDTTTVNSKIKDATSNTTDNYQPRLQTYTAAGIAAGSTIAVAQGLTVWGSSTSTARTGGIRVVSNPVIAEATATSLGIVVGTFPTNWLPLKTLVSYAPTVTLGTAPVMEFRKGTASTDSMMACLIGLYVEYVPPVVAGLTPGLMGHRMPARDQRTSGPASRGRF